MLCTEGATGRPQGPLHHLLNCPRLHPLLVQNWNGASLVSSRLRLDLLVPGQKGNTALTHWWAGTTAHTASGEHELAMW